MHNRSSMNQHRFNQHLSFHLYLNDVKGFYPYIHELKHYVFRFKKIHIQNAQRRLEQCFHDITTNNSRLLMNKDNLKTLNSEKRRLVSIHIRLGDYESYLEHVFGLSMVNRTYFTRAMNYILERDPVGLLDILKQHNDK